MNSGNILNSLLGVTSNNTVANKNTVVKVRAESGDRFRDALEQVRPEVAANKSKKPEIDIPRKAETSRSRNDAEPAAKSKAAQRQADRADAKHAAAEKADARKDPIRKDNDRQSVNDTSTTKKNVASNTRVDEADPENPEAVKQTDDSQEATVGVVASELINSLITSQNPADELGVALVVNGDETDLTAEGLLQSEALSNPIIESSEVDELALLLAEEQSVDALPVGLIPGTVTATPLATMQSTNTTGGSSPLASNQLSAAISQLVAETATEEAPQGNVDGDVDSSENPDFLTLLNSKTGLSKLMDAGVSSDKTNQVDLPKSILASTSLAEPLTRPTEAQSPAARSFVVQTGVPVTVGQPQWSQAVGDKVLWLAAQNVSTAEIRLDPPDLGQLHVKVSVNQDQASVTFTSPHPVVREALDQQLNRLREMFSEQGLNLVNVDVSDRSAAQQQQDQEHGAHSGSTADVEDEEQVPVAVTQISSRLVDHYA